MRTKHLELTPEQYKNIVSTIGFDEATASMLWEYMKNQDLTQSDLATKYGITQGRIHHVVKRFQAQMAKLTRLKNLTCMTVFVAPENMEKMRELDAFSKVKDPEKLLNPLEKIL